jgi:G patch domain-containing protein 1
MGMYGQMTRSVADFHPTRLLCKRFNVKPPMSSNEQNSDQGMETQMPVRKFHSRQDQAEERNTQKALPAPAPSTAPESNAWSQLGEKVPGPEENKAIEGSAAHAEVLKAIFGDSDSE